MDRRTYLQSTAAALTTGALAGCSGGDGDATGTLATSVSDQPGDIGDFESCVVTVAGVWVKPVRDDATDTSTETATGESEDRTYVEFDEPTEADLVNLQGEKSRLVGEESVDTGSYEYLQLDVTNVDGTLDGGESATVTTPGDAPLKFNQSFEVRADERTHFVADFTPVQQGNGGYIIRPVASETEVRYTTETPTSETTTN
ncbi:DUF4382 domain-containing protein [Haloarcula marina]|uniref:DUF4382 domain-containing protein n=1 Tax=Haloarcula marina TaxID=2961574 RepID=UPI0020B87262|nr:DUF4382 domain-containing protein [Halomicroarcula marina]